jgi:hypothetical protein
MFAGVVVCVLLEQLVAQARTDGHPQEARLAHVEDGKSFDLEQVELVRGRDTQTEKVGDLGEAAAVASSASAVDTDEEVVQIMRDGVAIRAVENVHESLR